MNSQWYQQKVLSHQQEIAKLQRQKAQELAKVSDLQKRSSDANNRARSTSSTSTASSYFSSAQRYSDQAATAQKNVASIEAKIAQEYQKLNEAQNNAANAEKREADERRRKEERRISDEKRQAESRRRDEERRAREHEQRMRSIDSTLTHYGHLHRQTFSAIKELTQLPEEIRVLFIAANPLDQEQLRLDEEVRAINDMIRKSEHRDAVRLESRWAVRPLDVLQALNELRPRVVHFSGHGSEQDEIVFQDDAGQTKLVSKEAIVQMMAASSDIALVFFNTCYSRNQAEAVVTHVQAAIGMTTKIGDHAARVFAAQFYSSIGFGHSIKRAFEQAKAALMLEGIEEEDTPELFVADGFLAEDLVLVKPPTHKA